MTQNHFTLFYGKDRVSSNVCLSQHHLLVGLVIFQCPDLWLVSCHQSKALIGQCWNSQQNPMVIQSDNGRLTSQTTVIRKIISKCTQKYCWNFRKDELFQIIFLIRNAWMKNDFKNLKSFLYLINNECKNIFIWTVRDVSFEYHQAVVPFCWAVRPVRSLSTLK